MPRSPRRSCCGLRRKKCSVEMSVWASSSLMGRKAVDIDIDALATLTLPLLDRTLEARRQFHFEQSSTELGDPALNALIGWHEGNWHWNLNTLLNVPRSEERRVGKECRYRCTA